MTLYEISFEGVKAQGDMALFNDDIAFLLSIYGSESQTRGIFSSLVRGSELTLNNTHTIARGIEGHLRFKSFKIGYGKYHALIWNDDLISRTIIALDDETQAWESFFKSRKIPFKKEWIPKIITILKRENLIEELQGVNLKGWHWKAKDNDVCNFITQEIYK